ncbi:hypothetical protein HZS_6398 [Henneguya salminicola]|nr:hypothetical protein HZS_6398 [Henneguya salminicola]
MLTTIENGHRSYKCLARAIIDGEQITEKSTHTSKKKVLISKKIETPILIPEQNTKDFIK